MAVVIRMKRAGAKKRPFFRVVVANSRSPRDGRYIDQVGYYDPLTNPATFKIDTQKFAMWVRRGAKPSESVGVMVAKHAPEALRPQAVIVELPVQAPAPEEAIEAAPKKKRGAAKAGKTAAKKSTARKPAAATKGKEKKARTRAKAKARKASGVAKPKATAKKKKEKK